MISTFCCTVKYLPTINWSITNWLWSTNRGHQQPDE